MPSLHRLLVVSLLVCASATPQEPGTPEFAAKIAALDLETATLDDLLRLFGEPQQYAWGNQTFSKDNLPATCFAVYPRGFSALINNRAIMELRFEQPGYAFRDALQVGSSLDEVLRLLGPPKAVFEQQPNGFVPGVLYRDIDGVRGVHYFASREHGVRVFFRDNQVCAFYLCRRELLPDLPIPVPPAIAAYSDVRRIGGRVVEGGKNVSQLDLSQSADVLPTLTFNLDTVWPDASRMPAGFSPIEVLIAAMDPYLGVREIHREGITGKGVSVAIIDQPMFLDHPQFEGKVAAYKDFDSQTDSSMHGPAVSSLLVGTNLGTAPDATLYFAAVPSWRKDAEYYAQALAWLLEINRTLPPERKIRVVSVSAAPSGPGTPYEKNTELWDWAFGAAEQEGILVLDCTQHRGRTGPCYFNFTGGDRNDPANCRPGYPGLVPNILPGRILAPASPRTTAEEFVKGAYGYQYTGRGGLSWTPPYIAGILALGWQLRPDLSASQMWDLLVQSAYAGDQSTRIVHPKAFLDRLRNPGTAGIDAGRPAPTSMETWGGPLVRSRTPRSGVCRAAGPARAASPPHISKRDGTFPPFPPAAYRPGAAR
jgi:hypothetical protein